MTVMSTGEAFFSVSDWRTSDDDADRVVLEVERVSGVPDRLDDILKPEAK